MKQPIVQRTIKVNPESTILHVVGKCGVVPHDEPQLLAAGYELTGIHAEDDVMTFTYELEENDDAQHHDLFDSQNIPEGK